MVTRLSNETSRDGFIGVFIGAFPTVGVHCFYVCDMPMPKQNPPWQSFQSILERPRYDPSLSSLDLGDD